jgi:hypothetical protein
MRAREGGIGEVFREDGGFARRYGELRSLDPQSVRLRAAADCLDTGARLVRRRRGRTLHDLAIHEPAGGVRLRGIGVRSIGADMQQEQKGQYDEASPGGEVETRAERRCFGPAEDR